MDDVLATVVAVTLACTVMLFAGVYMIGRRILRSLMLRRAELAYLRLFSRSRSRRELARARSDVLRATMGARSIVLMVDDHGSGGELRILHGRLLRLAETVDRQLEVLACEPDEQILEASLPQMRGRADQVTRAATELRTAASLLMEGATGYELDVLAEEARREVEALRYGRDVVSRQAAPLSSIN